MVLKEKSLGLNLGVKIKVSVLILVLKKKVLITSLISGPAVYRFYIANNVFDVKKCVDCEIEGADHRGRRRRT